MNRVRSRVDLCGGTSHARPLSAVLAVVGVVVIATAGGACGHIAGRSQNVAVPASATGSGSGGNGSGCPTQGVGGDSVPPACASPMTPSASGRGGVSPLPAPSSPAPSLSGPVVVTPSPPPPSSAPQALPAVTSVSPSSDPEPGGDTVIIGGSGFTSATQILFGGAGAQNFTVVSDTEITATSPPGTGTVDVIVDTPAGASATGPADQFTYVAGSTPTTSSPPSSGSADASTGPSS
jgi:IPT/TIG domain